MFEVFDADGKPLALWYCDYFKRDNKNGGAWMDRSGASRSCWARCPWSTTWPTSTKPAPGQPALLSFDDVTTMFHEFGHALHGMFADTEYPSLVGHRRCRAISSSFLRSSTSTGPAIRRCSSTTRSTTRPASRCRPSSPAKIKKAKTFNQGYDFTELLAAAELDMEWHTLPASAPLENPDTFEKEALEKTHLWLQRRAAALPLQLLPAHLGERLRTPATTRISGARCWTTMRSSGSKITAA